MITNEQTEDGCNKDKPVLATVLTMNIVVKRLDKEHIDIRDTAGIRLMLLNITDNKGLFIYFETRLSQYSS